MHPLSRNSIVMSVYNGEGSLRRCLQSIREQTRTNYELLIFDDGSTDGTWDVLSEYAESDRRIRIFKGDRNEGLTGRLNQLVGLASGDFIYRMDHDDIATPDRIEKQERCLDLGYDLCFGLFTLLSRGENYTFPRWFFRRLLIFALLIRNPVCHGSLAFRKSVWEALNGYCEDFARSQDYDFVSRAIISKRFKYCFTGTPVYVLNDKRPERVSILYRNEQRDLGARIRKANFGRIIYLCFGLRIGD